MELILTAGSPRPAGHYSQALVHRGIVYVSGQLPIDPVTGERITGGVEEQAARVLQNLAAILEAAGSSPDRVLKVTVYITGIEHWEAVNAVYAGFFGAHRPARSVVPVKELHHGCLIELEAIAAVADPAAPSFLGDAAGSGGADSA